MIFVPKRMINGYGCFFIGFLIWLVIVTVVLYVYAYLTMCGKFMLQDFMHIKRPKFLCLKFQGGLANQMFIYAFGLSMAKKRNMQFIVPSDNMLTKYFRILPNTWEDHGYHRRSCSCFWKREDEVDCGYDENLEKSPDTDLSFNGYFQSWKYWIDYEADVRKAFTFKSSILKEADKQISRILTLNNSSTANDTVLIGVHIRNGDYSESHFSQYGYQLAPASYLESATNYFRKRFKKVLFVVCTNDIPWTRKVLSVNNDVHIVSGNPAEVDMALLSRTNHTIMTVGTYGWMIAWLTRGTTLHYKYPYRAGSDFAKQFHSDYSDHFYPKWIAME